MQIYCVIALCRILQVLITPPRLIRNTQLEGTDAGGGDRRSGYVQLHRVILKHRSSENRHQAIETDALPSVATGGGSFIRMENSSLRAQCIACPRRRGGSLSEIAIQQLVLGALGTEQDNRPTLR